MFIMHQLEVNRMKIDGDMKFQKKIFFSFNENFHFIDLATTTI